MRKGQFWIAGLIGMCLGAAALSFAKNGEQPAQAAILPPAAGAMASLLSGKLYPFTIPDEKVLPEYHLVSLVDSQGKIDTYATKGETVTFGGETFLISYYAPLTAAPGGILQPKPGGSAMLTVINMHAIQAIGGFTPMPAAEKSTEGDKSGGETNPADPQAGPVK